jgi:hypothetical protein
LFVLANLRDKFTRAGIEGQIARSRKKHDRSNPAGQKAPPMAGGYDRQGIMRVSPPIFTRIFVALAAGAQEQPAGQVVELGPETNLPLPRFVSLRGGKVNVRRGPGLEYRIDWVFQRSGLPVRVIDEYGNWRRIADSDDAGGWVYPSRLTQRP